MHNVSCCVRADSSDGGSLLGALVLVETTLGCAICGANWVVLWCGLKLAPECVLSVVTWEGPISALPKTSPGLPGRNYNAICGLLLTMLNLEACEGGLDVN